VNTCHWQLRYDSRLLLRTVTFLYSRDVHPVARVIKSQDKNPRSQQSVNMLYCVLSMITTCFGLRKRPSSGDYHVTQSYYYCTICLNGSVATSSNFLLDILYYMIITWRWPLTKAETCRDHGEHAMKHIYGLLRTRVFVLWFGYDIPTTFVLLFKNYVLMIWFLVWFLCNILTPNAWLRTELEVKLCVQSTRTVTVADRPVVAAHS
jgi:hypothetical protein